MGKGCSHYYKGGESGRTTTRACHRGQHIQLHFFLLAGRIMKLGRKQSTKGWAKVVTTKPTR